LLLRRGLLFLLLRVYERRLGQKGQGEQNRARPSVTCESFHCRLREWYYEKTVATPMPRGPRRFSSPSAWAVQSSVQSSVQASACAVLKLPTWRLNS